MHQDEISKWDINDDCNHGPPRQASSSSCSPWELAPHGRPLLLRTGVQHSSRKCPAAFRFPESKMNTIDIDSWFLWLSSDLWDDIVASWCLDTVKTHPFSFLSSSQPRRRGRPRAMCSLWLHLFFRRHWKWASCNRGIQKHLTLTPNSTSILAFWLNH